MLTWAELQNSAIVVSIASNYCSHCVYNGFSFGIQKYILDNLFGKDY